MNTPMLWTARLVPPVLIGRHALGVFALTAAGAALSPWATSLILSAWIALALYSSVMWLRGDYIQRALNMKPWLGARDEVQAEAGRRAATITYMSVLFLLGGVIGLFLGKFPLAEEADLADTARAGHSLYAAIVFVAFVGSALPTAVMAWTLRPLPDDGAGDNHE